MSHETLLSESYHMTLYCEEGFVVSSTSVSYSFWFSWLTW